MFAIYFELGFRHIADWQAYDHILFLLVLCAGYSLRNWRRVLGLVTAFTVGHALTLALAGLDVVSLRQSWVEFLIPVTIVATALYNVANMPRSTRWGWVYGTTLCFGLIHGLGFSNYFRSLLFPDEANQLLTQLLAFNLGVEAGQLLIVALVLGLTAILVNVGKIDSRNWTIFSSGAAFGLALVMMLERWPY
ncbi:MAG: HupE/UreJ family protein [Bacteroidetes bacterium]|nr:MAG: HupE/UreJ family protein [Bacteroidota bacterium]